MLEGISKVKGRACMLSCFLIRAAGQLASNVRFKHPLGVSITWGNSVQS